MVHTGRKKRFKVGKGMWPAVGLDLWAGSGYFFGSREWLKVSVMSYKMIVIAATDICKHCCFWQWLSWIPCLTSQEPCEAGISSFTDYKICTLRFEGACWSCLIARVTELGGRLISAHQILYSGWGTYGF